jgi:hypothetical protein
VNVGCWREEGERREDVEGEVDTIGNVGVGLGAGEDSPVGDEVCGFGGGDGRASAGCAFLTEWLSNAFSVEAIIPCA